MSGTRATDTGPGRMFGPARTAGAPGPPGGLRRLARRATRPRPDVQERCELCSEPVPPAHRHLLQPATGAVSCACRPCALLFDHGPGGTRAGGASGTRDSGTGNAQDGGAQEGGGARDGSPRPAGHGGYLALPETRRRLDGCEIDDTVWAALGLPVKLAFFTRSAVADEITAAYPSPHGALRATVAPADWREVEKCHPDLPAMAPEVEALLVNRAEGAREHWLVPLDDCYRLVAVVRAHWKGLGGGPDVRQRIDDFFRQLTALTTEEASWASPWESPT